MCSQHAKLSREEVIEIFNNKFREEFATNAANIRSVARGHTAFSNTRKEWWGIGGISAAVIIIGGVFSTLSALGLISGFISLGVGLGVALAGVVAGIAFRKHHINKKNAAYRDAELFIENEMTPDHQEKLRAKLQVELLPVLQNSTRSQIRSAMRTVMAALTNLIINKQVHRFADFETNNFRMLLAISMKKTPMFAMNTTTIQSLIIRMPDNRDQSNVIDRVPASEWQLTRLETQSSFHRNSMWPSQVKSDNTFQDERVENVNHHSI